MEINESFALATITWGKASTSYDLQLFPRDSSTDKFRRTCWDVHLDPVMLLDPKDGLSRHSKRCFFLVKVSWEWLIWSWLASFLCKLMLSNCHLICSWGFLDLRIKEQLFIHSFVSNKQNDTLYSTTTIKRQ